MEKYDIQKLRDLHIEEVAERLGLEVSRHKTLCCFHDDHKPSLTFNVRKNNFRCYSCGAHGGTIDLAMHVLNKGFLEACEWLSDGSICLNIRRREETEKQGKEYKFDASRYQRYFEHPWLSPEACKFLFGVRHLNPAVVRFCRLNSFRDWLQIPYYNQKKELIGIQRRYMGSDPNEPRFKFLRGEECHLYNQQVIPMLKEEEPLYLGEGPSDVWALLSSGKKAVGIPSATLLKPKDLLSLKGCECHIYPDKDDAGESLYKKLITAANEIGFCLIRHELPEGCKDYSDYWVRQVLPVTRP